VNGTQVANVARILTEIVEDIKVNNVFMIRQANEKIYITLLILILLLTIFGCGGGGSGGGNGASAQDSGGVNDSAPSSPTPNSSVNLSWDPPKSNADGTALTGLAGFRIYYGKNTDSHYPSSMDVGTSTIATIDNLSSGTWCFAVTAYDSSGNESDYSQGVCADV